MSAANGVEVFDADLQSVEDLELVAPGSGLLEIANPIYREIIPRGRKIWVLLVPS